MDKSQSISVSLSRLILATSLLIGAALVWSQAGAQQSGSGAVETFEPEFDVAVEMRPRVGLFGITELMMAALEADIPRAKQLLDEGADINERDDSQSTPLMWAVHSGDVEIVRFLIAEGANVRAKAFRNATALMVAMTGKHEASAVALIDAGADANGRGNSAMNYLEDAAMSGMTDVVDALIRNGTDLDTYGGSALYWAVLRGHTGTAGRLLDAGVGANAAVPHSDESLISFAAASGNVALVGLLIANGADIGQPGDRSSPLYPAAINGRTEVVRLLIENGVPSTADLALAAIRKGHAETAAVLLNELDLETIRFSKVEQLVSAADELGNDTVTTLLLDSELVRSIIRKANAPATLVYFSQSATDCAVKRFDPTLARSVEVAVVPECSGQPYISRSSTKLFYVLDDELFFVDIFEEHAVPEKLPLPDDDFLAHRASAGKFSTVDLVHPDDRLNTYWAGSLQDGRVVVAMSLRLVADDAIVLLLAHTDDKWQVVDQYHCDNWEWPCIFPKFEREQEAWHKSDDDLSMWGIDENSNEHLASAVLENIRGPYGNYTAERELRFEVNDSVVIVRASGHHSAHGLGVYTSELSFQFNAPGGTVIDGKRCDISFFDRYLLRHPCGTSSLGRVYDMETGSIVVRDIASVAWARD